MDKKQIQTSVTIFKRRIIDRFQPEKIILFGSYARGAADEFSDVDVVVVSKKFSTIPFSKRLDAVYPLISDLSPDFHVFSYTPQEYHAMSPLLSISEAKTSGVTL